MCVQNPQRAPLRASWSMGESPRAGSTSLHGQTATGEHSVTATEVFGPGTLIYGVLWACLEVAMGGSHRNNATQSSCQKI